VWLYRVMERLGRLVEEVEDARRDIRGYYLDRKDYRGVPDEIGEAAGRLANARRSLEEARSRVEGRLALVLLDEYVRETREGYAARRG